MSDISWFPQALTSEQLAHRAAVIGRRPCRPRPRRRLWLGAVATWPGVGAYDHLGAPQQPGPDPR